MRGVWCGPEQLPTAREYPTLRGAVELSEEVLIMGLVPESAHIDKDNSHIGKSFHPTLRISEVLNLGHGTIACNTLRQEIFPL